VSLPFLSDSSFGAQDYFVVLGGPNVAIGQVYNSSWLMVTPTPCVGIWGIFWRG